MFVVRLKKSSQLSCGEHSSTQNTFDCFSFCFVGGVSSVAFSWISGTSLFSCLFFLSTIRSRLRLLVRMDSPDASAVRRVASETDSHRWVPAEPHPGAWTNRANRDGGRQEVGWVVRVMGRVIGRVVDRQERDIHIYTRTDTDTHILLAKPDADGRAPLGRVPLQRLYRIMPPHLERTSVRWRSWAFLATCAPATTDELAENSVQLFFNSI
jgi:hypothetical protein